jgi:hypothetical protein
LARLAILASELGWDDDERRTRAGVASFTELTKAQASDLIEDWQRAAEPAGSSAAPEGPGHTAPPGPSSQPDDDMRSGVISRISVALDVLFGTVRRSEERSRWVNNQLSGFGKKRQSDLTIDELQAIASAAEAAAKGKIASEVEESGW